jgi:hypothetical protein
MSNTPGTTVIGIPWFFREDYDAFRRLIPQRSWHDTFDQWEVDANKLVDMQKSVGARVFKAPVQSDTFAQWCRLNGHELGSHALSVYASECARRAVS